MSVALTPSVSALKRFSRAAGVIVAALGVVVLVGWLLDSTALKSIFPGLAPMKANTALSFVLTGLSLVLLAPEAISKSRKNIGRVLAILAVGLGALTLSEYVLGRDLGIDLL